jgi:hypothetical protein
LPIVDLSKPDAAEKLYKAMSEVGFQAIVNHGIEDIALKAAEQVEKFLGTSSRAELDALRKFTPGYGPGLQNRGHMAAEEYETEEGVYTTGKRDDFVVIHPEAAARKATGEEYYNGPAAKSGLQMRPTAIQMRR